MPLFDYKCPRCGAVRHDVLVMSLNTYVWCHHCVSQTQMERLPSAPSFSVAGYNAKNGYSK